MAVLEINGISVGYDDDGDGPALLLVHGHPFDRSMWLPQIRHFSRAGCRVIAPDLRGYGSTTVVPGRTELSVSPGTSPPCSTPLACATSSWPACPWAGRS